jgi:lipopolysaccharide export system permease protein
VLEKYIHRQTLWPLVASVATLGLLALLTQSVSTLDLIINQRQSVFTYLQITLLAMPQLIAYVLPLALFVAVIYSVNRLQNDSELIVCAAAGMSKRSIASPLMKIAIGAMIANLAINLWVQPFSFREMRERLFEVRGDLAAKLVRPGAFNTPARGLTIYARELEPGGKLVDVLIQDASNPEAVVTYLARSGEFTEVRGAPILVLNDASFQSVNPKTHILTYGTSDSYRFPLDALVDTAGGLFYKLSDRYLDQLFFPPPEEEGAGAVHQKNRLLALAEGHYRLSAPLYAPALVLIALASILGGEFSRTGYARRIAIAAVVALVVRLAGFAVQSACTDNAWLNIFQYAIPIATMHLGAKALFSNKLTRPKFRRGPAPTPTPAVAAEASPA